MPGNALMRTDDKSQAIVEMVLDSLDSPHSKRAYKRALTDFMTWYRQTGQTRLGKATVNRYRKHLLDQGMGHSSVNLRLSSIRKLAAEAADNGLLTAQAANGIARVKGVRQEGTRTGNWLDKGQAEALLDAPPRDTLKGKRDRAMLAVLIGCALRRAELAGLTFEHIQQRDGRWVILDLVGKRGRVRTVPMPSWCKALIDRWTEAAEIENGIVFRPVNKGDHLAGESMTAQAIYATVKRYAEALSLENLAVHDLRRTHAKLAHKGGAPIDQIQLSLGHASIKTTEVYLGVEQDLTDAPCDRLGLRLEYARPERLDNPDVSGLGCSR